MGRNELGKLLKKNISVYNSNSASENAMYGKL